MRYTDSSFSVSAPSSKQYRDNYDRTFGKPSRSTGQVPPKKRRSAASKAKSK